MIISHNLIKHQCLHVLNIRWSMANELKICIISRKEKRDNFESFFLIKNK